MFVSLQLRIGISLLQLGVDLLDLLENEVGAHLR